MKAYKKNAPLAMNQMPTLNQSQTCLSVSSLYIISPLTWKILESRCKKGHIKRESKTYEKLTLYTYRTYQYIKTEVQPFQCEEGLSHSHSGGPIYTTCSSTKCLTQRYTVCVHKQKGCMDLYHPLIIFIY